MHTAKNLVHKHLNIYFLGFFNKTIISLALVGYEMIIANSVLPASLANYHLISNGHSWNNCSLATVNPLLSPTEGLFISNPFEGEGGLNRDGGLI